MIARWMPLALLVACAREGERERVYAEPARCIEVDCGPIRADAGAPPSASSTDDAGYLREGP